MQCVWDLYRFLYRFLTQFYSLNEVLLDILWHPMRLMYDFLWCMYCAMLLCSMVLYVCCIDFVQISCMRSLSIFLVYYMLYFMYDYGVWEGFLVFSLDLFIVIYLVCFVHLLCIIHVMYFFVGISWGFLGRLYVTLYFIMMYVGSVRDVLQLLYNFCYGFVVVCQYFYMSCVDLLGSL